MIKPDIKLTTDTFPERYQILHLLGSGGSGDAYLAWDTSLHREIVIKRVRTNATDEKAVRWIREEAGKMAALKHPNIVAVHDVALSEGMPCIVMEHVLGQNLDQLVSCSGPLRVEVFVELAKQTLDALFTAHEIGMIHRDLKPSNVMISNLPSGSIQSKLLDFGLAKFIDTQAPSPQTVSIGGDIHGTTHYISPEQLSREPVGVSSDLYSLGCTLYFGLTGKPPFEGSTIAEVITSHLNNWVISPASLRPDLPLELCVWLMQLIERHPTDRFASALEALQALRGAALSAGVLSMTTCSIPVGLSTAAQPLPEPAAAALGQKIAPVVTQQNGKNRRWIPITLGIAATLALGIFFGSTGLGNMKTRIQKPPVEMAMLGSQPSSVQELPAPATFLTPVVTAPTEEKVSIIVPPPPVIPTPAPEPKIMFRVAGSNTIGAELLPALMEKFLLKMDAKNIRREQFIPDETVLSFDRAGTNERQGVLVQAHGSSTAFQALEKGACDIGISSRPIKKEESERLQSLGNMLSPTCEHVVGLDGLAVIVCRSNPVNSLNTSQIAGIFSGEIRDWAEVGGSPGPIHLHARDDQSGTYDSFRSMILGDRVLNSEAKRYEDSSALTKAVSTDAAGIGFIGLPYVRAAKALAVSEAGAQALFPNSFSVATEDYGLSRRLFLYTAMVPRHPWTTAFTEFALTDEGQKLVEESGFISQQVAIENILTTTTMPERYRKFAKTAEGRLSLSFRFRSGKTELDAKAVRDLDRVVRLLAKPENRRKQVRLLGFSDQSGNRYSNIKLSEDRAREILAQLSLRGVSVSDVLAMGSEMPVASNDTKIGQEKNRRVEIWVSCL